LGGLIVKCTKCGVEGECTCGAEKIEKVRNLKEFKKMEPKLVVLARSRPEDKYLLVTALKET
jgi:hypothetical protein